MGFGIVSFGFISYHCLSLCLFCPFYHCITPFFVLVCVLILLSMNMNLHAIGLPILILMVPCR